MKPQPNDRRVRFRDPNAEPHTVEAKPEPVKPVKKTTTRRKKK